MNNDVRFLGYLKKNEIPSIQRTTFILLDEFLDEGDPDRRKETDFLLASHSITQKILKKADIDYVYFRSLWKMSKGEIKFHLPSIKWSFPIFNQLSDEKLISDLSELWEYLYHGQNSYLESRKKRFSLQQFNDYVIECFTLSKHMELKSKKGLLIILRNKGKRSIYFKPIPEVTDGINPTREILKTAGIIGSNIKGKNLNSILTKREQSKIGHQLGYIKGVVHSSQDMSHNPERIRTIEICLDILNAKLKKQLIHFEGSLSDFIKLVKRLNEVGKLIVKRNVREDGARDYLLEIELYKKTIRLETLPQAIYLVFLLLKEIPKKSPTVNLYKIKIIYKFLLNNSRDRSARIEDLFETKKNTVHKKFKEYKSKINQAFKAELNEVVVKNYIILEEGDYYHINTHKKRIDLRDFKKDLNQVKIKDI